MKLRSKFLVVYLITLALCATGFGLFQHGIVLESFLSIEDSQTRQSLNRAVAAVNQSLVNLASTVVDWAPWDDTYLFLAGKNPRYIEDNLSAQTVMNLHVNLLLFLDDSGKVFYGAYFDSGRQDFQPMPDGLVESILGHEKLTHPTVDQGVIQGFIDTVSGPMLVAAHPILKNDFSGPPRGILIMGRFFNKPLVDSLSQITGLKLALKGYHETGQVETDPGLMELLKKDDTVIRTTGPGELAASRLIRDPEGQPALILTIKMPREIFNRGQATAIISFWWVVGLGLFLALLVWVLLNRMVIARWTRLERDVQQIGQSEDLSRRLKVDSNDELGSLTDNINQMMDRLEEARQKERESERRFAQAFDHAALGMALADTQGHFLDVNPYFCLMLGYSREELLGMQFNDITEPDDRQVGLEVMRETLSGEREYAWLEKRYRHRNGQVV